MRSVNLIPAEELRGDRAPTRAGPAAYVIVGVLVAALLGVTGMALTSKSISSKKDELAGLEAQQQEATARANELSPFAQFRAMQQARQLTVASLAQSRFDWERVLNELSLILPSNIQLTNITGTVSPDVQVDNSAGISSRASIPGPALELIGCGADQDAVAGFVATLEDIDGVTRVGLSSSERSTTAAAAGTTAGGSSDSSDCRTNDKISQFQVIVAFDAVPTPAVAGQVPVSPVPGATSTDGQLASTSAVPGG